MTDEQPTVWPIEPHTSAKHSILRKYLGAWFPILSRHTSKYQMQDRTNQGNRILYIDGFAGPGVYKMGEPGSPVIAIRTARDHAHKFPFPVEMIFIEQREDRYQVLEEVLEPEILAAESSGNIHAVKPHQGDCDTVLNSLFDQYESNNIKFGPALAFLDQFGYGSVSMNLIKRILKYPQCEVFSYLNYKEMNRWISDPNKAPAFDRAYGDSRWQDCVNMPEKQRRDCLLEKYLAALKEKAGAKYVSSFLMYDKNNVPLYWLLFCTNNIRGLEEMKKAMWSVDRSGGFKFSDKDNPNQLRLLDDQFDQPWLAEELETQLGGKEMTVADLKEFVLVNTPCHLFKDALKRLENSEKLEIARPPAGRRPGTFPDDRIEAIVIRFAKGLF